MTTTELQYWDQQEAKRHNRAVEDYNERVLAETNRSNLANEAIRAGTLSETNRSNLEREHLGYLGAMETQRSNLASEQLRAVSNSIEQSKVDAQKMIAMLQDTQKANERGLTAKSLAQQALQLRANLQFKYDELSSLEDRAALDRDARAILATRRNELDREIATLNYEVNKLVAEGQLTKATLDALKTAASMSTRK